MGHSFIMPCFLGLVWTPPPFFIKKQFLTDPSPLSLKIPFWFSPLPLFICSFFITMYIHSSFSEGGIISLASQLPQPEHSQHGLHLVTSLTSLHIKPQSESLSTVACWRGSLSLCASALDLLLFHPWKWQIYWFD